MGICSKSLKLFGPRELHWVEEGLPGLQSHEVLVRTIACAISIGSELPVYRGGHIGTVHTEFPHQVGYESYGEVVDVDADVSDLRIGDRVVAFYGQKDYAVCRDTSVIPVSPGIEPDCALLTILSCDMAKGAFKVNLNPSDRVLVTGLGTIGLLTVYFLRQYMKVEHVDAIEPDPRRAEMGELFGVRRCFPKQPPTDETYEIGFECSARNAAFQVLQSSMNKHGRVCILSDGNYDELVLHPKFFENELNIVGSSDGYDYHKHAKWFFGHVGDTPYINRLFEHRISQESLIGCFEDLASGRIHPLKVLVTY